jgi:hypothetical protein
MHQSLAVVAYTKPSKADLECLKIAEPLDSGTGTGTFTSASGCNWTSTSYCQTQTYPKACSYTIQSSFTCANTCTITTTSGSCTGATTTPGCGFTYREGDCSTSTSWCTTNTMNASAQSCLTDANNASGQCSPKSWNVSCVTTFGGSDCTVQGACLKTYAVNCLATSVLAGQNQCGSQGTSAAGTQSVTSVACSAGGSSSMLCLNQLLDRLGAMSE